MKVEGQWWLEAGGVISLYLYYGSNQTSNPRAKQELKNEYKTSISIPFTNFQYTHLKSSTLML